MIEIKVDWINDITYSWSDFVPLIVGQVTILALAIYALYKTA